MTFDMTIINALIALSSIITIDALITIVATIRNKTFDMHKVPQFLANNLFPYVGVLLIIALFANFVPDMKYAFWGVYAVLGGIFTKEALVDKFKMLVKKPE